MNLLFNIKFAKYDLCFLYLKFDKFFSGMIFFLFAFTFFFFYSTFQCYIFLSRMYDDIEYINKIKMK